MVVLGIALAGLAGCATDQQTLDSKQSAALESAVNRGRFELSCPEATGSVLSRQLIEPLRFGGVERAEYTIGIEGCGQRKTSIVVCAVDGSGCFAAESIR